MASDGLLSPAKMGKCRICRRIRKTDTQVKAVGEVHHGYATGHIWECIDIENCEAIAMERANSNRPDSKYITIALQEGRFTEYRFYS